MTEGLFRFLRKADVWTLKVKLSQQQEVAQVLVWVLNPKPTLTRLLCDPIATESHKETVDVPGCKQPFHNV